MKEIPLESIRLALISPSAKATSETFIQQHKRGMRAQVFHFHNGHMPKAMDGKSLIDSNLVARVMRKFSSPTFSNLEEQAFYQALRNQKIEVVLAEYGPTAARVLPACIEAGIPLIPHFHGYDASQYDIISRYKASYEMLFNKAAAIVAVSQEMRQDLIAMGAPSDRTLHLPCLPEESFLRMNPAIAEPLSFFFVGRFVDKKAPYQLILAMKSALEMGMEAQLVMAGDGPLWSTCKQLVRAFGLEERIELCGKIEHEEVLNRMQNCLAYVQHSVQAENGDKEGTPVAVMEALAASKAVVSTRHAGIKDMVRDGESGILVEEHDYQSMAKAMFQLSKNREMARRMGEAGRKSMKSWMKDHNSIESLNQLVMDVYRAHHVG